MKHQLGLAVYRVLEGLQLRIAIRILQGQWRLKQISFQRTFEELKGKYSQEELREILAEVAKDQKSIATFIDHGITVEVRFTGTAQDLLTLLEERNSEE